MQKQSSSESLPNVLSPTVPADVGVQSQRQRIIDAMIVSCAEKTYAETTIGDIVSAASISRTTFYKRFADKRTCFDATLQYCIEEVEAAIGVSCSGEEEPSEAVREASVAVLEMMAARPKLARFLAEAVAIDPRVGSRYRELAIPAIEGLWSGNRPRGGMDPGLAFGRIVVLVFSQVAAGRADRLPGFHPEIVYLALTPFAGHDEALRQSRLATEENTPQPLGQH